MYTFGKIVWEARQPQNKFGDISYLIPTIITARKEPLTEIIKIDGGKEALSKSVYYVEPFTEPNALLISKMDKLDGEIIIESYEMRTLTGQVRMIRFKTV